MKSFKQHLGEMFDSPVKGRQMYDVENGRQYTYFFNVENREYFFNVEGEWRHTNQGQRAYSYEISFGLERKGAKFGQTNYNTGQLKILSTVINRTHYYFNEKHPLQPGNQITFGADTIERVPLYDKFAKHLASVYGLDIHHYKGMMGYEWELTKR